MSLREEVVLGLITCVGEGFVSRPHLLGDSAQGDLLLNLRQVEGRRNCLRIKMKKRRKVKLMKKSRKLDRMLTSRMHGR